jgi:hypothetical protein
VVLLGVPSHAVILVVGTVAIAVEVATVEFLHLFQVWILIHMEILFILERGEVGVLEAIEIARPEMRS